MLIRGGWKVDDDGVAQPLLHGQVADPHGGSVDVDFLVDTGADQTVLSADHYAALVPDDAEATRNLLGVGGELPAAVVPTVLRFVTTDGRPVNLHESFAVFATPDGLGISVLGRVVVAVRRDRGPQARPRLLARPRTRLRHSGRLTAPGPEFVASTSRRVGGTRNATMGVTANRVKIART